MTILGSDSSPVAQHVLLGPHGRFLPGCSGGQRQSKTVMISNAMMKAYTKMRGPCLGGAEDPLFEWIRLREDLQERNPPPGDRKDISRMLAKIDHVLESENPDGNSPRDAIFAIERPAIDHICPPAGMDLSLQAMSACCGDFEFEEDSDDEEAHVPSGRISPCTFLAWAKDCTRWEDNAIKVPTDENAARQRPPTPEVSDTPPARPRSNRYPPWGNRQYDIETGVEMSPCYPVPWEPSILWTAEGIDTDRVDNVGFDHKYSRMDPIAGRKLHELRHQGNMQETTSPTGEHDRYTYSEVEAAITQSPLANLRLNCCPLPDGPVAGPEEINSHLGRKYNTIALNDRASMHLITLLREQTIKIRDLEQQKDDVRAAIAYLKHKRHELNLLEQQEKRKEKKKKRIRDHVANHVREVDWEHERSCERVEGEREKVMKNEGVIGALEMDLFEICFEIGKISPEEVYEELARVEGRLQDGDGVVRGQSPSGSGGNINGVKVNEANPFARYVDESPEKPSPTRGGLDAESETF
ncbi:uncharacterized protein BCR38DRAFT_528608 [Pseudomassariella vexata]|uniref:Uncharacterized protein n=1 Tax=Pseudomassariella vexata TaxID=1141098 RepID=A0A1Y2D9X6_9PEZI|nr:uncharacterized protein BCR38DRAFT_528608 [Pseudomassariella vexata]ORY56071.1 hypothetical protein BCR38DRAFT_528608 [Pseudomassariella vexata]